MAEEAKLAKHQTEFVKQHAKSLDGVYKKYVFTEDVKQDTSSQWSFYQMNLWDDDWWFWWLVRGPGCYQWFLFGVASYIDFTAMDPSPIFLIFSWRCYMTRQSRLKDRKQGIHVNVPRMVFVLGCGCPIENSASLLCVDQDHFNFWKMFPKSTPSFPKYFSFQ